MRRIKFGAAFLLCLQMSAAPATAAVSNGTQNMQQQAAFESRSLLRQGKALLQRGSADQALVVLENALRLFKLSGDEKGVAAAQDALGDLYQRQGRYKTALDYYQKAYSTFRSDSDSYNSDLMLAKVGDMNFHQNKFSEALAAYGQMNAPQPKMGAENVYNAAKSKVTKARGFFDRMRNVATTTPTTSTATATTAIATDAASEIKNGLNLYRQFVIYSIHELGLGRVAYANNQLDEAKTRFKNALDAAAGGNLPIISGLGQTLRFRVAARTSLGDVAYGQSRYADAVKLYAEAASGAQTDKRLDLMWPAQRGLGRGRWAMAQLERDANKSAKLKEEAIAAYRDALHTIETIRAGSLRADDTRATFLATTKDVFDEASSLLAEMALSGGAGAATTLSGKALEYAAESFRVLEQGRARSLLDMLAESGATLSEGVPADLLKKKRENSDRQQEIAQILTGVSLGAEAPEKPIAELDAELDRLSDEEDQIENQIRLANPRYGALTAPQPLSIADVQRQVLDEQTVLLEYGLGQKSSYLWAVTAQSVTLSKLAPRAQIDKMAIDLRAQMIPAQLRRQIVGINVAEGDQQQRGLGLGAAENNPAVGAYAAASHALYKAILEPIAPLVGKERRLLVVADGALNYVPFEALVTEPSGASYDALPYLVKTNEITYAPSASVVAAVRQSAAASPRQAGGSLLLVADPIFDAGDSRARAKTPAPGGAAAGTGATEPARGLSLGSAVTDVTEATSADAGTTDGGAGPKLARLEGTRVEAQQIAQLARASGRTPSLWLDHEASESSVKSRDIKGYRVIHIATHGLLNAERPQFSGLVLSQVGNGGAAGDGFLRTDEIFDLRLGSPLVMLSACETGLGKETRGEGVIGLTRAFMYAGAPTVGVSLWSVADRSTAELMSDFYRRLLTNNHAPSAAMRAAQQNMIAGKKYSAPFYWAPFVLIGDWR